MNERNWPLTFEFGAGFIKKVSSVWKKSLIGSESFFEEVSYNHLVG
jgi:hypothetical protein